MSASDTGDFLRLARSWLRIVAASGVNFSELWRPEQNFVLAQKVPLQFPLDRLSLPPTAD
jgi:hypothetical protein